MHNSLIAIKSDSPVIESLETLGCGLHPILHAKWETLIGQSSGLIESLIRKHGSPLHLVAPSILCENLQKLQDAIHQHGVKSQVLYAMKANKGLALVRHASNAGFGIDVASEHEFSIATTQSQESTTISLSGPIKPNSLFEAAIQRGAMISIDSVEELRSLRDHLMASRPSKKAKVYLRYCPTFIKSSRFGMSAGGVRICSQLLAEFNVMIEFVGFHFHLPGYSAAERGRTVNELMVLVSELGERGLRTRILNMGGGIPVQYVQAEAFETFMELHHGDAIEYRGGKPTGYYPYGGHQSLEMWIDKFMRHFLGPGLQVADWLRQSEITLAVEPGRSALDQVAISLFRVGLVKDQGTHSTLFLNGSSFSASETWFRSDYLCDPLILRIGHRHRSQPLHAKPYYLAGHSCLEDDVIAIRPFSGKANVVTGDVLAFANTAGYQMDLMENNFHQYPTPVRLNVDFTNLTFSPE